MQRSECARNASSANATLQARVHCSGGPTRTKLNGQMPSGCLILLETAQNCLTGFNSSLSGASAVLSGSR
eukprot:4348033-Alexandrium_andersonii.AAC.1